MIDKQFDPALELILACDLKQVGTKQPNQECETGSATYGRQYPSVESHCCCAHDWPYFRDPVHPYDYSADWDLEIEWNERMTTAPHSKDR